MNEPRPTDLERVRFKLFEGLTVDRSEVEQLCAEVDRLRAANTRAVQTLTMMGIDKYRDDAAWLRLNIAGVARALTGYTTTSPTEQWAELLHELDGCPPSPHALWQQAKREHPDDPDGHRDRYIELMRQHAHLIPKNPGKVELRSTNEPTGADNA